MTKPNESTSETDARLVQVLDQYLAAVEAGRTPDKEQLLERFPDLAEDLKACLASLEFVRVAALKPAPASAVPALQDIEPASGVLGDYRIVRVIGRGGMGVVYEAVQISLNRRVALKVLPLAAVLDPRRLHRFKSEAQAAAQLHHTNIVPVFSVGCERGVHYYAMQYIEGQPLTEVIGELRQRCRQPGDNLTSPHNAAPHRTTLGTENTGDLVPASDRDQSIPPSDPNSHHWPNLAVSSEAAPVSTVVAALSTDCSRSAPSYFRAIANLGVQAAQALEHAHEMGVIHRDIKPSNLLLDGKGKIWITDFGLAQIQSDVELTMTGDVLGTVRYMSPEQASGQRLLMDHRTDVYSLGITLYELLTLVPAFPGQNRPELLQKIGRDEPVSPRRLNKQIPTELETIVLKAISKNPASRYATAQELAEDLDRFVRDEPIRATRPTVLERVRRWTRRHRPLVISAAVLATVTALLGSAGWLWISIETAARTAALSRVADGAIQHAREYLKTNNIPQAAASIARAEGVLAGGSPDPKLRVDAWRLRQDLMIAQRLEELRTRPSDDVSRDRFNVERADAVYAQVFRDYGIELFEQDAAEVAAVLQQCTIRGQLVAAIDDWGLIQKYRRPAAGERWSKLLQIAVAADDHPQRNQIRTAVERSDEQELTRFAEPDNVEKLSPGIAVLLSDSLARMDKLDAAVAVLMQAQRNHPDDFLVNHQLALRLTRLMPPRIDEAIRFYTAAVALRPRSPGVHVNMGKALSAKGRHDDAIAHYRKAIELKSDYAMAYNNLGVALEDKGLMDEAIAAYRDAVRIDSDLALAHHNLAFVLMYEKRQVDEAIASFQEAVRSDPNYPEAWYNLGLALQNEKKDTPAAIAAYRNAIRARPSFAKAHCNLGLAQLTMDHLDDAMASLREAVRYQANLPNAHLNLGIALERSDQLDEAIASYREAIRHNAEYARAYCALGLALQRKGDLRGALTALERGHELGSKHPNWTDPSAAWIEECKRQLELEQTARPPP